MQLIDFSKVLWGRRAKLRYLLLASALLLFTLLGSHELWTQEHRWADIVSAMLYSHDFLHPVLDGNEYYDKPLLSYWLIVILAKIMQGLSACVLRLPSALAGLLAIFTIYHLGKVLKDKKLGLCAGWLLLTTFYFVFWARTSSADMLNMSGALCAVTWYRVKRDQPVSFLNYAVFFLILALTALCKGLVGPVVAVLAVLTDVFLSSPKKHLEKHFNWRAAAAIIPALMIYILPFWASTHFGKSYAENGLVLVYRENILRYFQPFDHKDPIYAYLIYLPVYLLPWTVFFIFGLYYLKSQWAKLSVNSRWIAWTVGVLFLFFTLSGSRRSYYILPMVPFAILFTADWILCGIEASQRRVKLAGWCAVLSFVGLFLNFVIIQPIYYSQSSLAAFGKDVKKTAMQNKPNQPWESWKIVMLDPESKVRFYLQLSPEIKNYPVIGHRQTQTTASLLASWQILRTPSQDTIFITRKLYMNSLKPLLKDYQIIEEKTGWIQNKLHINNQDMAVAFIPKNEIE